MTVFPTRRTTMTRTLSWPRLVLAAFTLATLALLLYTIGAPGEISPN